VADREVGKAVITLRTDDTRLRGDIDSIKNRITNAVRDIDRAAKITPQVDTSRVDIASRRLDDLRKSLGLVDRVHAQPSATLGGDAQAKLVGVEQTAERVDRVRPIVHVAADTDAAEGGLSRVLSIAKTLAITVGTGFLLNALKNASRAIGTFAVQTVASFEQVQVAFTGLFQNADIANDFLGDLQTFAAKTPFEFEQLTGAAQKLLSSFGRGFRNELIPTLGVIGDVAATLGQGTVAVDRVILAISQIQGKGKVATQELNQIREALPGFNAAQAIATGLGLTLQETTKKIESGSLDADTAIKALIQGMREFPGAAGAMERQSVTLNGRISTLKDNISILARGSFTPLALSVGTVVDVFGSAAQIGGELEGVFSTVSKALTSIVTNAAPRLIPFIEAVGDGFGRLLTVIGPLITKGLPLLTRLIDPLVTVLEVLLVAVDAGAPILEVFATVVEALGTVIGIIPVGVIEALTYALIVWQVATIAATLSAVALGTAVVTLGAEFATGATLAASALGPLTLLIAGATTAFLLFRDDGPSEQQKAFRAATEGVTDALIENISALGSDADALALLVENGELAKTTLGILNDALLGLREIELPSGAGLSIFGTPEDIRASSLALREGFTSAEQALIAIGVPQDKTLAFLEAVRKGGTDFSGVFPTDAQAASAVRAYADLNNGVIASDHATRRLTGAFGALQVAGLFTTETFELLGSGIRSSVEALAASDPVAAKLLANFKEIGNVEFITTQGQLDLFLTKLAEAKGLLDDTRTTDFTGLITAVGALATPSERASVALKGVSEELDKLNGKKISLREATAAVEELIDKLDGKDSVFTKQRKIGVTLDPTFAVGRDNQAALASAIGLFTAEAQAIYDESGDPLLAEARFSANIDQLRADFVKAGGDVQTFNDALASGAYGANEVTFKTVLDEQSAIAMTAAVSELAKQSPVIAASIQANIDAGKLDDAQAQLDALAQLNEGGYFPEITPEMDPEASAEVERKILALVAQVTAERTLRVVLEADSSKFERQMRDLRFGGPFEAGGVIRRFEAGGLLQATAPHFIGAAQAAQGPHWMYGEPSTQGEAFISMAPKWRDRSVAIWKETGRMLGQAHATPAAVAVQDLSPLVARVDAMTRRLGKVAEAVAKMPPITVQAVGGSAENAAAKIWWANKARMVDG